MLTMHLQCLSHSINECSNEWSDLTDWIFHCPTALGSRTRTNDDGDVFLLAAALVDPHHITWCPSLERSKQFPGISDGLFSRIKLHYVSPMRKKNGNYFVY